METRTRLLLVFAGLPCPETNVPVFDDHGQWIGRPDLAYRRLRLAIQYEGDVHRTAGDGGSRTSAGTRCCRNTTGG